MTSPPTFCLRASRPVTTPFDVDTSATPIPARMDGIRSWVTYTRRPGVDTRTSPEIIFSLPTPYWRYTRRVPCFWSSSNRKFLMKPSSFRISAMRTLSREAGMSTFSCSARLALRMRVSRSAIGSLRIRPLPARLHDARNLALERQLAKAEPAHLELPEVAARAAAQLAPGIGARAELRLTLRLHDERGLRHMRLLPERHSEVREEHLRVFVRARRRHDADVHAAHLVHLVVDDLRKDQLLAEAERVIAPPVEALGRHTPEVAHARQRDVDQPVEELVHPGPAERDLRADRHALAQLEVRDRLLRLRDDGPLARDRLQVGGREVEHLGVFPPLAHAHVDDDLLEARDLVRVRVPALLHDRLDHRLVVEVLEPRGRLARPLRAPLGDGRRRRGRPLALLRLGLRRRRLGRRGLLRGSLFFRHDLSPCRSLRRSACRRGACARRRGP